jgi:hypothetical protein
MLPRVRPTTITPTRRVGNYMTETKPKRSWFQFSLRMMFVALIVFGIWFGWQVSIVRERKALLLQLQKAHAEVLGDGAAGDDWDAEQSPQLREFIAANRRDLRGFLAGQHPAYISFVRRLLGDQNIFYVTLPNSFEHDRKTFVIAFPEAFVTLRPSSELSTTTLIEFLNGDQRKSDYDTASPRAIAIDVLGARKAQEAIPYLIECLNDFRALEGSDNSVCGHAANALASITGREFSVNQVEWKQWWKNREQR